MPLRPPAVLERLQAALQGLPGIGKRSAERVANYLLQAPVEEAQALADAITQARAALHPCSLCGRLYDADSMNEIGNREKPHLRFWWQLSRGEMVNLPVGNNETWLYTSQDGD